MSSVPAVAQEVVFQDPSGDENGPGTYTLPSVQGFRKGSFDLREVRLRAMADGVEVTVTWQSPPERVQVRTSSGAVHREIPMQVVDLYFQDPTQGPGHREVLPGRRVVVQDPRGWHRGIILSGIPEVLEAHYRRVAPDRAQDLCFPQGLRWTGRTVHARVPRRCLPAEWSRSGVLVLVTALGAGGGFQGMAGGADRRAAWDAEDPWVRRVDAVVGQCNVWEDGLGASPCAIGGCQPCEGHPFVLDLLVPEGTTQQGLLGAYGPGRPAALPLVFPAGTAPGEGSSPGPPPTPDPPSRLPVASIRGETLSLRVPPGIDPAREWPPGTLGALVCPGDQPGGTVVVRGAAGGFLVADHLPDGRPPCPGSEVAF
ncbi:MAG TPA: glucodextranase DOMON-like domain-containing protein [Myxococcota bacterium]|nr:glucodextranase DOMON-like domain-containing protein [Myxococcota bacterium]HQK49814.1 glucodextranase DOMON-like domain-containing protein [Myxococcota bacterium]